MRGKIIAALLFIPLWLCPPCRLFHRHPYLGNGWHDLGCDNVAYPAGWPDCVARMGVLL